MTVLHHIVARHAHELASLWEVRRHIVSAPHTSLRDLAKLDHRLDANLEGLLLTGEQAFEVCRENLDLTSAGDVFAHALVALSGAAPEPLRIVLEAAHAEPEAFSGLCGALGQLPLACVLPRLEAWSASSEPKLRQLALAGMRAQRHDPGQALPAALEDPDHGVRLEALRLAGELGRMDTAGPLRAHVRDSDAASSFWAAWSASLLSVERDALLRLERECDALGPECERAVQLAVRCLDAQAAAGLLVSLGKRPTHARVAALGAAARGTVDTIPWLLEQLETPALARVAANAFACITGAALEKSQLAGEPLPGVDAGPSDDPADERVALDPDMHLAWPVPERIRAYWSAHACRYASGERYLLGIEISEAHCVQQLQDGRQPQRAAAALELVLAGPRPLFDVTAPVARQLALLLPN